MRFPGHYAEAPNDLAGSAVGRPHRAVCRTDRAEEVYELLQDYSGAGAAAEASNAARLAFLDRGRIPHSQWRSSAAREPSKATKRAMRCDSVDRGQPTDSRAQNGPICAWGALLPGRL